MRYCDCAVCCQRNDEGMSRHHPDVRDREHLPKNMYRPPFQDDVANGCLPYREAPNDQVRDYVLSVYTFSGRWMVFFERQASPDPRSETRSRVLCTSKRVGERRAFRHVVQDRQRRVPCATMLVCGQPVLGGVGHAVSGALSRLCWLYKDLHVCNCRDVKRDWLSVNGRVRALCSPL